MNRTHSPLLRFVVILCLWVPGWLLAEQAATTPAFGMARPALSPNGKTSAFEWMSSIWIVSVTGGEAVQLSDWAMRRFVPVWSPDGRRIACIATDKEVRTLAIQVFNSETRNQPEELWKKDREIKPSLDWSPDGKQLAFSLDSCQSVHFLPIEGAVLRPLEVKGMHPRWSRIFIWLISTRDGKLAL